jgi:nucleotide-binding universal stress UspA family protein
MTSMHKEAEQNRQNQIDKVLSEFMNKHAEELADLTTPETLIIQGYPTHSIQEIAAERQVDLIVMNSRTHSRLEQIMIGSTANKIIHSSQVPVLVVPIK